MAEFFKYIEVGEGALLYWVQKGSEHLHPGPCFVTEVVRLPSGNWLVKLRPEEPTAPGQGSCR